MIKKIIMASVVAVSLSSCSSEPIELMTSDNGHAPVATWTPGTLIQTNSGVVQGVKATEKVFSWLGIPFAETPQRWQKPEPVKAWDGVLDASKLGSMCLQSNSDYSALKGSADCLTLNIWRPNTAETDLPVYIWIHGGGHSVGNSVQHAEYNGANFANKANVIFVSMNYRLGALGWFAHPSLRTGDLENDSGNFGTLDIIESLHWVQKNIGAFGGDASNVTIHGQSAGGKNVISLLLSPKAEGLFHKAIIESGLQRVFSMLEAEGQAQQSLQHLLVKDGRAKDQPEAEQMVSNWSKDEVAEYLKGKSDFDIIDAIPREGAGMYMIKALYADGNVIVKQGADAFIDGRYPNKVPVMTGSNKDENALFLIFAKPELRSNPALFHAVEDISSDIWKNNGVDDLARKLTNLGQPVYAYEFNWNSYNEDGSGGFELKGTPFQPFSGSTHNLDVPFFFGNTDTLLSNPMLQANIYAQDTAQGRINLSDAIIAYTAQFARTGNPGTGVNANLPQWQAWSNADNKAKRLELTIAGDNLTPAFSMLKGEVTAKDIYQQLTESQMAERVETEIRYSNVGREMQAILNIESQH